MGITLCEGLITADIQRDCSNPNFGGFEQVGYIINKSDIASFTRADNEVSAITLKAGARAYQVYNTGNNPFTGTQKTLVTSAVANKFDKQVSLIVPEIGPTVENSVIDQLANGSFVVVLEHSHQGDGGKATFEIIGLEKGAKASEMTNDQYSEDTDGGWAVSLSESGAPSSGVYFYTESVAASRAALNALLEEAS